VPLCALPKKGAADDVRGVQACYCEIEIPEKRMDKAFQVLAVQAGAAPSVLSSGVVIWPQMRASVIALVLTLLVQIRLRASHPPTAPKQR